MRHGLIGMLAVVGSLMAVSAAPASAAVHWSDATKGMKLAGSLTVSSSGKTTKTCTIGASPQSSKIEGAFAQVSNVGSELRMSCSGGGEFGIWWISEATSTTSVRINFSTEFATEPWTGGPMSWYYQNIFGPTVGDFTNGSGGTQSKLVFSSDEIGRTKANVPIYISGTITVTNSSGGLITLVP